mmetsp:Transcript_43805/g.93048  ORF Transcript_43805/g.93048 Transcript_43805/m.93048 type:complete len:132 (+) Transcript_43805:59-454(+)
MGRKKFMNQTDMKVAVIGDEDTVTGFVLAGVGQRDGQGSTNFLIVDSKTKRRDVEDKFHEMAGRRDIGVILINQSIAEDIRHLLTDHTARGIVVPTVLEIPSKEKPYDPNADQVMQRVKVFFGGNIDTSDW